MNSVFYKNLGLYFFTLLALVIFSSDVFAQIEIFGFGGYEVASDVAVAQGDLNVYSNPNYGASIAFEVDRGLQAELLWIGQQTTMDLKQLNGITKPLFDIGIHYFQLGVIHEFKQNSKQKAFPFGSFSLGATMFTPHGSTYSDEWLFSIAFGAGGKFYLSDKIGLRLQARLLLPINFSSVGMWCGSGGCSATVGSWATFVQADFTGGIFVRLGK